MQVIIPVAGAGKKLRPHTYTQPKALLPLAGKTILATIIDKLLDSKVDEFIFILGYLGDKIEEYIGIAYPNLKCHFISQNERRGIGDAIYQAKNLVANSGEVLIVLGDTVFDTDLAPVLAAPDNMIGIKKVDDPRRFGTAETDGNGRVTRLVEKPIIPKSNQAIVGIYKIKDVQPLFEQLHISIEKEISQEIQLTDAMENMVRNGYVFQSFKVKNWYDCGQKDSLLATNEILLKKKGGFIDPSVEAANTIIIPPVTIAANTKIKDAIVGPNVCIGSNSVVENAVVKNCIVGSYTGLREIVLQNSIIGSDATIKGLSKSLNIGDNTEIDFG